jgi:RNA polymerase sigma-70 factor (ECF subfamily)
MDFDAYAKDLIHYTAIRLVGKYGLTRFDREDIEQDLFLDLLQRLPDYDPKRAKLNTFIARVVEHGVATLIERRQAEKRDWRRCRLSLNRPASYEDADGPEFGEFVETDYRRREVRNDDLAIEMAGVLKTLPPRLRDICRGLMRDGVTQVAADLGLSRMTIHRGMKVIRARFEDAGLDQYL